MKDRGLLHPTLLRVLAETGHGDLIGVTDAGLPIPPTVVRIDLALTRGVVSFEDVVRALTPELRIEAMVIAAETFEHSPQVADLLVSLVPHAEVVRVSHEELKLREAQERSPSSLEGCGSGTTDLDDRWEEHRMATTDEDASASELIDARIEELDDWRVAVLARVRALIHQAEPDVVESVKWRKPSNPGGVPVWELDGILCTGETYKDKVKLTFAHGAALHDPAGLFNASLSAGTRRAIDLYEGDELDEDAFLQLVAAAAAHNATRN